MNEKTKLQVEVPLGHWQAVQGAIEHIVNQLLRHDEQPVKAYKRFSEFDCTYLSSMVGSLCIIRESIADSINKQNEKEKQNETNG